MESVISNEQNKGETRLMTPKSSLLVNSWFHLCQLLINSSKLEKGTRDYCYFSLEFERILMDHVDESSSSVNYKHLCEYMYVSLKFVPFYKIIPKLKRQNVFKKFAHWPLAHKPIFFIFTR